MNLYLLQMIFKSGKNKITLFIFIFLFFSIVDSQITPLPLCQVCATNNGVSCLTCATCKYYATLASGLCSCSKGYTVDSTNSSNCILDLPLCKTCAANDGISCISCSVCSNYAVLGSGYCTCAKGYFLNNQDSSNVFCDRCHTSCNTCFGPLAGNCITCSDRYVFNQTGSICTPPSNSTDQVLIDAYTFYGFSVLSGWSYTTQTANTYVTQCGSRTILGGPGVIKGGSVITLTYTVPTLAYHFALRIKMGFYIFNAGGSTAQAWISVSAATPTSNRTYSNQTTSINSCSGYDFIHFNIDDTFMHEQTTATIQIGLTAAQYYGFRQFYLITKKCEATNCSKCAGYLANQCTVCVDSKRLATFTINNGTCLCSGNYYQQPYSGQCVDPCPSVPIQYYGDPTTRYCQLTCPSGYFALDDTYRCQTDCPTISSKSSYLLFRDTTNKKCVTTCPTTQPYAYTVDRTCYSTCPATTYASDAYDRRCVATCQQDAKYKLYAHNGKCIPQCPDGFWADPATVKCLTNCTSPSYPFKDNSTGSNVCVSMCPAPNMFGQTTDYYCVKTCPNGTFGERFDASNNMLQRCIAKCNSPRWGLITDNRKCVDVCPLDFWGQPTNRVCTNVTADCNPRFADNYTRQCVAAGSCSIGFFADNSTWRCVSFCPNNTYAHPTSKICQSQCDSPLFRDPGVRRCVSSCVTLGTYADVSSTRTCVPSCNITGSTPWADQSTRTCVNDCNNTITSYLADNTTWKCVYRCPPNYYADLTTTAPICVGTCPSTYYADNSTGTGLCVQKCSQFPRKFGDATGNLNLCVDVCSAPNLYGDQTGNRLCQTSCPNTPTVYYAQNDSSKLCVKKCKDKTYGYNNYCLQLPTLCPVGYFGDDSTNLCVNLCPASQGTFGDPISKLCVRKCPLNPNSSLGQPDTYYADISNRLCVLTCNASYSTGLFGNNNTRTCQTKCLDINSYAQTQTVNRICVARCLPASTFKYANNDTKVCGTSFACQTNYYGQNFTQICVQFCPSGSFAYKTNVIKLCIDVCPIDSNSVDWFGDITTGKRICVTSCPTLPLRFADPTTKLCVQTCPNLYYGDTVNRKCVTLCPVGYFAHQSTRRCVAKCPDTFFGDDTATVRYCHPNSALCGARFGDPFLNLCVGTCTGPSPVNLFGSGDDCVSYCPNGTYADSDTGTRLCVADCPNYSGSGGRDLYGDPTTHTCEPKCITPNTWADYQTRDCQATCSATPTPTYSQNFNMKCVTSLNCPTSPSMTFGDNSTRSCLSNCTNNQFGDPNSRNCVTQCPKTAQTGTEHYYGDKSTGINLCITICPSTPRLFGDNATNLCVAQCPQPLYGDQQGKRTCVPGCPLVGGTVMYYAQNTSRICVKVCMNGTWGLTSTRQCVETPNLCGSQWADNTTNMCVTTCPAISNLYADPTTKFCVPVCPSTYYSDDKTRTCVQRCPDNNGIHGTFANNQSRVCEQYCSEQNAFADPQTLNRYCVLLCSQSPLQSFADPSTKSCVKRCPVFPSLYAQTQNLNFKCVSKCTMPYYADTNTRRCQLSCPSSQYKLNGSQICVTTCPQNPNLYADPNSGFCQQVCKNNYHRYPTDRTCIPSCKSIGYFTYNFTCVKFCPYGYYADSNGICISPCTSSTYGQNTTTECLPTCITGYAQGSLCVANCDDGLFGQNNICKNSCTSPNRASNQTNLCVSNCQTGTYLQNGKCDSNCTTGYADPSINQCAPSCSNGRFGDPTTKRCVLTCPQGYYRDATGYCLNDCSVNNRRADNITWNCEPICSSGTWGYNFRCVTICPPGFYGYTVDRDCYDLTNQPSTTLFADNNTQTWVAVCPLSPLRYGDRTKKQCVSACISGQFADPSSRQCQTGCTNTSYFADTTTKTCVLICSNGFYSNTNNNQCQNQCTGGKFAYLPSRQCLNPCPAPYFGYNDGLGVLTCVLRCPNNTYGQGRLCVSGCSTLYADDSTNLCVSTCIGTFANLGTHKCQISCASFGKFSDNSTNTCVSQCPSDPDYYQQNNICVSTCSDGKFADPTSGTRSCRSGCPAPLYAQPQSKRCLSSCKPGYFGRNGTRTCSKTCLSGQYADNSTGFCQSGCQSPFFADPLTNQCVQICSGNQFGQGTVCVNKCNAPNYANPLTRKCQTSCPQFDYLFAQNTTRSCVKDCKIVPNSYADKNVRICMDACSLALQFALDSLGTCVSLCPSGLFMDSLTKKCQPICTTGFAEPTSRYCVPRCYGSPDTYGHIDAIDGRKTCVYKCLTPSQNLYADNRTNLCVSLCLDPMYSDPLSGNCVLFCPQGLYAQDTGRTCSPTCNSTQFADNYTRKCVNTCPSDTQQTFGHFGVQKCLRICPQNYFARNDTRQCVLSTGCASNSWADPISKYCVLRCPSDPLTFGWNTQLKCVSRCSQIEDLYGEFVTQTCVAACDVVNGIQTYQDVYTRTCVFRCPIQQQLWADTTDNRCKRDCSGSQIRDNSTQKCVVTCPSDPQSYADTVTKFCVRTCPNGKFSSDAVARVCTSNCSSYSFTYGDNTTNRCTNLCPIPYFSDNTTYLCVLNCPSSVDYYADPHSRRCVLNCPKSANWVSYADPDSRTCVTKCPNGKYAVNSTQRCVSQCPPNQYADKELNLCVADCTVRPGFYKQLNDRVCVAQCPTSITQTYKYEVNNSCVYSSGGISGCPGLYYANPLNKMCTTLCPLGYFAELSSKMCVSQCQANFVADPTDRKCKSGCTLIPQYYAYDLQKICVQHCPAPYFNNNQTYRCTLDCTTTPLMFRYYQTRQCVDYCHYPYFSYQPNRTCLQSCPNGYFAQEKTRSCVLNCDSPYFADDSTNRCVDVCPSTPDYYGYLNVCGLTCPNNFYRDNSTRLCVSACPVFPLMFADNSTNTCVKYCPANQNFFADNFTRKCVLNCSVGLFAEVSSRTCVKTCPKNLLTYADPITRVCQPTCPATYYASQVTKECVQLCPNQPVQTYSHINKCLERCPQDFYGQNSTRTCRSDCLNINHTFADETTNLCVTTCPIGLFAQNITQWCVQQCPSDSFADPTTRICVLQCPGTQRLYADPTSWRCVSQCPSGYYGDSNTWKCLQNCPDTASGYRLDVGRLCVQECPTPYFAFIPTRNCVLNCGAGLYGDPVTRTCKDCPSECPTCLSPINCLTCTSTMYLSYGKCVTQCILNDDVANYANDETKTCVVATKCPTGMYGYNSTKKCTNSCPPQMYSNDTTRTCQNCPQYCTACKNLTYCSSCSADALFSKKDNFCYPYCNSTHKYYLQKNCVDTCPDGTYLDYTQINCQKCNDVCFTCYGNALNCTRCFESFKYQGKCLSQCPQNYYGADSECKACTPDIPSCSNPLSFEVKPTVQNFQPVLVIKFNQQTTVNGNPKDFLKIRLTMKRRLLMKQQKQQIINDQVEKVGKQKRNLQGDMINDGVDFDFEILADGTIKLILKPGMSLDNVNFNVDFTDSNAIQTKNGAQSLQTLSNTVQVQRIQVYPDNLMTTAKQYAIIGTLLAVAIILPVIFLLICSPIAVFHSLQAFQLISLFAYVQQIPPNLLYFLRQLRISRFTFLPSMFSSVYVEPQQYVQAIPPNLKLTEGLLSFVVTAGGFTLIGLVYLLLVGIAYLASSKYNNNRPLRNMFTQIYNTRIKYGILHDLMWIFSINIFISVFMQFKYTQNGGDTALAVLSMLGFLFGILYLGYKMRNYQKTPYQQRQLRLQRRANMAFYMQGTKQSIVRQHTSTAYYIRKLLFTIIMAAIITDSYSLAIILLVLQLAMFIYLLILRPYIDNFRNLLHILNEFGLGFIPCGIIYLVKIRQMKQPIGHKMKCGEIMIFVIIAHLSIAVFWAYFRSYFFIKQLIKSFKQTQFYKLYMDEQFQNQLQKQIKELGNDQKGEIESVQVTNYNDKQIDQDDQQNQIIKLKIKRKRIKNKNSELVKQAKDLDNQGNNKRHQKEQYIKLQEQKIDDSKAQVLNKNKKAQYQKLQLSNELSSIYDETDRKNLLNQNKPIQMDKKMRKSIHDQQWVVLKLEQSQKASQNDQNKQLNKNEDLLDLQRKQHQLQNNQGYKRQTLQNGIISQMSDQIELNKIEQSQKDIKQSNQPVIKQLEKPKQSLENLRSQDIFDMIQDLEEQQVVNKIQAQHKPIANNAEVESDKIQQNSQIISQQDQISNAELIQSKQNVQIQQNSNQTFQFIQKSNQNFSDLNIQLPKSNQVVKLQQIKQKQVQQSQNKNYQQSEQQWHKYQIIQSQNNSQVNEDDEWQKLSENKNSKTNMINKPILTNVEQQKQQELPWNMAYKKSKNNNKNSKKVIKFDNENNQEDGKVHRQVNNWADLQNMFGQKEQAEQKKAQKKKIQMMIFDEEDFESEANQNQSQNME